MSRLCIDINSDLGESVEALASGADLELMRYVSSANIACGGHAGDGTTMRRTLEAARSLNVAVGAHPSYPDRANFGRIAMSISANDLEASVLQQISSLARIAEELRMRIAHVKPHGALYHAARERSVAEAIGRAVLNINPKLVMVGQSGSSAIDHWRAMGLECATEAFADRAYEKDGSLRSRNLPGALLDTPGAAAEQALSIASRHQVSEIGGGSLAIAADTICIHSDTPNAATIANEIRNKLGIAGFQVRPFSIQY